MNKIKWWQWILIIITTGIVFYVCYPKYNVLEDGIYAFNKITGNIKLAFEPGSSASQLKQAQLFQKVSQLKQAELFQQLKK